MQSQTRGRLLIWTLFSARWKLMVWKMRKLKAYLRPSLTSFCRIFFWKHAEKRRRIKLRASKSFQKFRSHGGPVEMNAPESPFYLVDRHYGHSTEEIFDIWRYPSEKMKQESSCPLQRRMPAFREGKEVINHSLRKTCILRLLVAP